MKLGILVGHLTIRAGLSLTQLPPIGSPPLTELPGCASVGVDALSHAATGCPRVEWYARGTSPLRRGKGRNRGGISKGGTQKKGWGALIGI